MNETYENPLYEEPVWRKEDGFGIDASKIGVTPVANTMRSVTELLSGLDENKLMAALTAPKEEIKKEIGDSVISEEDRLVAGSVERMPSNIRAMMLLAEAYDMIEGDFHEILTTPIALGLTKIRIDCPEVKVRQIYEDLYTALKMQNKVKYNWLYGATHGQGYPLEVWDGASPQVITYLDPKAVNVGNPLLFGRRSMSLEDEAYKKRLVAQNEPMLIYDSFGSNWNSFEVYGNNIPLNPEFVTQLHIDKWPHTRYAIPPVARAYRSITTRQRLEEMVLATIEGVKNQLWLFTKERFARGEAAALDSVLQETRGDHLGYLIWPDLEVKQFVPGSIDALLAPEKWFDLTRHIFRQLGISMYVVSGELPGGTRGNPEIDVRLLMQKLEDDRTRQIEWLDDFNRKFAKKNNIDLKKYPVSVRFTLNTFGKEDLIKNTLATLATFGQISSHTFLKEVGYDYDMEREYKEEEVPYMHLFGPMRSFAQTATNRFGETKTTESSGQMGRTPDAQNPEQLMKASIEDYQAAISRSYRDVKEAKSKEDREKAIAAFVASLMMANVSFMADAYREGYSEAGGIGEPSPERMEAIALWNNQYAENFRDDMLEALAAEEFPDFEWRANLYAPQGWRLSYIAGMFQAKKEQGITGWQRVIHPEMSQSGSCEWCIADSQVIHSIDEEFSDHPHGYCGLRWLNFWRGPMSTMPVRIPPLEYPVPRVSRGQA